MEINDKDLLRYNINDKYILTIDSETNGLNYLYTRPFEIAFNIYKAGQLIESNDIYLKYPDYKIDPSLAIKVHYDKEKIDNIGIEPKKAFEIVKDYLDNPKYIYCGSNVLNYDCMIFHNSAKNVGVDIGYNYLNKLYDTNALFKAYKLGRKPNNENFLAWQWNINSIVKRGLKSRVEICCQEFGIEYNELDGHGAKYDCSRSFLVLLELIKKMEII